MVDPRGFAVRATSPQGVRPAHDPLDRISRKKLSHFETIFPFLKNALLPGASTNSNANRLDVTISEVLVNSSDPIKILDLGCGEWLLLEKLLEVGGANPSAHYSYLGIDSFQSKDHPRWPMLCEMDSAKRFAFIEHLHFDFLEIKALQGAIEPYGTFDHIYLGNVLHELRPRSALTLLEFLFTLLSPSGMLVLIDPEWRWCISREAWTAKEGHLLGLPVEWEMNAVWQSADGILAILSSLGFHATLHPEHRSTDFWMAAATHKGGRETVDHSMSHIAFTRQMELQVESELTRIENLRSNLRELFRSANTLSSELLIRTMEFFAACASQCKRMESLRDFQRNP